MNSFHINASIFEKFTIFCYLFYKNRYKIEILINILYAISPRALKLITCNNTIFKIYPAI
jgi:hypothetical protein